MVQQVNSNDMEETKETQGEILGKLEIYARMALIFVDMAETCSFNAMNIAGGVAMDTIFKTQCAEDFFRIADIKNKFAAADKGARELLDYVYSEKKRATSDIIIGNSDFLFTAVFLLMQKTAPDDSGEKKMLETLRKMPDKRGYLYRILGDALIEK